MRKLDFAFDDEGKQKYEICSQAIMLAGKSVEPKDWDDFLPLMKKFKAAGEPAAEQPPGTKKDRPILFELAGPCAIHLERGEYNILIDLIKQPIWRPVILEDVIEVRDWLTKLEDTNSSLAKDAKPEAKRKAKLELAPNAE